MRHRMAARTAALAECAAGEEARQREGCVQSRAQFTMACAGHFFASGQNQTAARLHSPRAVVAPLCASRSGKGEVCSNLDYSHRVARGTFALPLAAAAYATAASSETAIALAES